MRDTASGAGALEPAYDVLIDRRPGVPPDADQDARDRARQGLRRVHGPPDRAVRSAVPRSQQHSTPRSDAAFESDRASRRITFFITGLYLGGGAEAQLVRIARHMAESGWRVSVVSLMPVLEYGSVLERSGITVSSLGIPRGRYDPRALTRLVATLRRERPDVLCTFMFHANVLGRFAARIAGVPKVVSSVRNTTFGGAWADRLLRWTDGLCDVTTTNSQRGASLLAERALVRREALHVIPNGIDVAAMDAVPPDREWLAAELGIDEGTFVWVSIGRLEPQKAHGVSIEALARLVARGAGPHLAIVGEGSERERLEREVDSAGLRRYVSFVGLRSDVPRWLRSADGMVLASRWEGLPNVVMEAQAAGTPVVATDVGGVAELVDDGVSGLLVPPGEPQALATAMERLMSLPAAERTELSNRARRHVEGRFGLSTVMGRWTELFEGLVDR